MQRLNNGADVLILHREVVLDVLSKMPSEKMFSNLANTFKLIGDNTRCKILFALDKSEMCVGDIANILNMTKSSVSHQLAILKKSGITKCQKKGKEVLYRLDDEHITKLFEVALEHIYHRESEGL